MTKNALLLYRILIQIVKLEIIRLVSGNNVFAIER